MKRALLVMGLVVGLCGSAAAFDQHDHSQPAELRYNSFEGTWGYERPSDILRYNSFEDEWSYQDHGETMQYNPYQGTWEWTE